MIYRLSILSGLAGLFASSAALADVPRVATDIAPVHALVAQVIKGLGEPTLIVQPGSSPHGYSMRPSEAQGVQDADAVFWIGPELEPWMENAIANLAPGADAVELLDVSDTRTLEFRTGATFALHDHGDLDGHEHDDGHADEEDAADEHAEHADDAHGHSHEGVDPHAWLDPENAKVWLDAIAGTLSGLDPENAETYASNATSGKAQIDEAAADAADTLQPVSDLRFVVLHDAYHYYETRFGLATVGAIELGDASDPSAARIEEVRETVRELDVSCIFSEPQFNQSLVRTVAEGTDARTGTIDPLGMDIAPGPDFYPQLIRTIAEDVASCVQ